VDAFFEMFYRLYDDAREIGAARIGVVGPATASRVREFRLKVDVQPEKNVAEELVAALKKEGSVENVKILLVRAEVTREIVAPALIEMGAIVDEAIAYRTVPAGGEAGRPEVALDRFRAEGADLLTFASSSSVENFLALKLALPPGMQVATLGPITSKTARAAGLPVALEAPSADLDAFARAIAAHFARRPPE
jgi:uroporphyrinogen III methyltransferase/synthase